MVTLSPDPCTCLRASGTILRASQTAYAAPSNPRRFSMHPSVVPGPPEALQPPLRVLGFANGTRGRRSLGSILGNQI